MAPKANTAALRNLLSTTKDGDWGKQSPSDDFVPYRVIRGADFPSVRIGDTSTVPVRYLSASTVHRRTLKQDDILLETAGGSPNRPTGRSLLITDKILSSLGLPATCASFARFLRVDSSKADPRYVYWHLQYLYATGQMEEHQVQHTGVARFQYTKFAETQQIPLPAVDEQRAIAQILGTLDDKIELSRRVNETLEAMARALFKSWFVDFDPVRAKSEGRAPGPPKPVADLFPESFEDSELGAIPKGWGVATIDDVCNVVDCLHSKKPERRESGRLLLQLSNIRDDGLIDMADAYYIDEPDYVLWISRMEASPGDCVITNVGRVGAVAQIPSGVRAALGRNMTGIRCKVIFPYPTFLIEALLSEPMNDEIGTRIDSGTILDALNVRSIPKLRFVRPADGVVEQFETLVRPLRQRMEAVLAESHTLGALRDSLMPRLISGELRVPVAERVAARYA